jgi:hypothetical protein
MKSICHVSSGPQFDITKVAPKGATAA